MQSKKKIVKYPGLHNTNTETESFSNTFWNRLQFSLQNLKASRRPSLLLPISKLHIRFFEKSIWHFDMTAQSKTPAGYCLYHFSRLFPAKSFKTTTFLCEYLRCRIVRKHCKKFIAKVGSEIISRTTFLHLDTKWEWPTRLAKKTRIRKKTARAEMETICWEAEKSPFSERKQKRKGCHMCSDARLHFSLYSVYAYILRIFWNYVLYEKCSQFPACFS